MEVIAKVLLSLEPGFPGDLVDRPSALHASHDTHARRPISMALLSGGQRIRFAGEMSMASRAARESLLRPYLPVRLS